MTGTIVCDACGVLAGGHVGIAHVASAINHWRDGHTVRARRSAIPIIRGLANVIAIAQQPVGVRPTATSHASGPGFGIGTGAAFTWGTTTPSSSGRNPW